MKDDVPVKDGIVIPRHELEISASRAGGPGGQHVNKTSTRISVRWNVNQTHALDEIEKKRVLRNLQSELTSDGDLIVHSGASRSQQQNKKSALALLAQKVRKALHVPKKRMKTYVPRLVKEARLYKKKQRGALKESRRTKIEE